MHGQWNTRSSTEVGVECIVSCRLCDAVGGGNTHESDAVLKHQPHSYCRQQRHAEMVIKISSGGQRCAEVASDYLRFRTGSFTQITFH